MLLLIFFFRRKPNESFKRTASAATASEIPYCGENNAGDEQKTFNASSEPQISYQFTKNDSRGKIYEIPDFIKKVYQLSILYYILNDNSE